MRRAPRIIAAPCEFTALQSRRRTAYYAAAYELVIELARERLEGMRDEADARGVKLMERAIDYAAEKLGVTVES